MSSDTEIRVPEHSPHSRVSKALKGANRDGSWNRLLDMGLSSAEQTARSRNVEGAAWEFGFTIDVKAGEPISVLWARYVG